MAQANSTPLSDEEERRKKAAYMREYTRKNKERVAATAKASFARNYAKDPQKALERGRKWREANPDKMQSFRDNWLDKGDNREKIRLHKAQKQAERRVNNKEAVYAATKAWKLKNKERIKAYQKAWKQAHKVEHTLGQQARHTKTKIKINKEDIINWESRICGICLKSIEGPFHIDHIIPISKGGPHAVSNLQLAHPFCNLSKKNKLGYQASA